MARLTPAGRQVMKSAETAVPPHAGWFRRHLWLLISPVAVLVILVVAAVGAVGWVGSERAMYPERKVEDHALSEYPFAAETEEVRFAGHDGTSLAGWFLPATRDPAPAVILVHGYGRSRAELLPHAAYLHSAGFNVLLFDFRGRGESGGGAVTIGAREPLDVRGAVTYVLTRSEVDPTRVIVQGVSLGASSGIMAMADDPRIAAVVAEAPFSDARGLVDSAYENFLDLPSFPFGPVSAFILERRLDADMDDIRPIDDITRIGQRPVFLIEDVDDVDMPPRSARRLYAVASGPKDLWTVEGARHAKAYVVAPQEYERRVLAFYDAHHLGPQFAPGATPTDIQSLDAPISTEELAIRLLPYLASETDAPAGYRPAGVDVDTPATQALKETAPGADPWAAFDRNQRQFLIQLHQFLRPVASTTPPVYTVKVMIDAETARRTTSAADPPASSVTRLPITSPLGEASVAWQWSIMDPTGQAREVTEVRWFRGRLAYSVQRTAPPGGAGFDELLAIARWADARAATLPPLDFTPRVSAPATEAERLEALLRLRAFDVPAEDVPAGFRLLPPGIGSFHPAQGVVNLTLLNPDFGADAALNRFAEVWQRVYTAGAWFGRGEGQDAPKLVSIVGLDADEAAAERDVRDPIEAVFGISQPTSQPEVAPVRLGETTTFFVFRVPPAPDGSPSGESMALRWRHGSVVLSAESVGAAGAVSLDELVTFARAVEAAYQASVLAR